MLLSRHASTQAKHQIVYPCDTTTPFPRIRRGRLDVFLAWHQAADKIYQSFLKKELFWLKLGELGVSGGWGLGVRVRMRGVCLDDKSISRFFILWLGVPLIFHCFFASFGPQPVGR